MCVGTSSEENGILIGRFLIHVVLTQWNVRLEKHDQKMDKKLVGQQGFPFRALEIRIVLISRYIHIELVVRLFYSIAVTTTILSPHSALKFAKKCNFEKFASKDEIDFFLIFSQTGPEGYTCTIQFFEHCAVSGLHHQRHLTEMRNARQSPSLMPMVWKKIHDPPQYYFEHNGQTYLFKME